MGLKLREKLNLVLLEYISTFEKKQGLHLEFAVSDDLMGVLSFGDVLFINIENVIYDIDNKVKKGVVVDWIYDSLEQYKIEGKSINFESYSKGLRYEHLKK